VNVPHSFFKEIWAVISKNVSADRFVRRYWNNCRIRLTGNSFTSNSTAMVTIQIVSHVIQVSLNSTFIK
jgi:hypothetical protein